MTSGREKAADAEAARRSMQQKALAAARRLGVVSPLDTAPEPGNGDGPGVRRLPRRSDPPREFDSRQFPAVMVGARMIQAVLGRTSSKLGMPVQIWTPISGRLCGRIIERDGIGVACFVLPDAADDQEGLPVEEMQGWPGFARCDLLAASRPVIVDALIDAVIAAGESWWRPSEPLGTPVEWRTDWPERRIRGPELEGLRCRLETAAGDDFSGPLFGWYKQMGRRLETTAFGSAVSVNLTAFAIHPETGFSVFCEADDPREPIDGRSYCVNSWMFDNPYSWTEGVINTILWSYDIPEDTPEHTRRRGIMQKAVFDTPAEEALRRDR